jgi:diketogulonate reductase-like aldo/keto reductase
MPRLLTLCYARYLIHEPWNLHTPAEYQDAWRAMEDVKMSGKARSIGVNNFVRKDIQFILDGDTADPPVINQLEYHPYIQSKNSGEPYIPWMQQRGIQVEAFKGLSPVARCPEGPLVEPLQRIASAHATNESAVMLRWFLQQGVVAITTTAHTSRLQQYAAALKFQLAEEEMEEISRIGKTFWKRFYFPERYADDDRS